MPSTFTNSLRIEKQASGENLSTWGTKVNASFDQYDFAIAGLTSVSVSSGNSRLTISNGSTDTSRAAMVVVHGAPSGACSVVSPAVTKMYLVANNTTGGQTITFTCSAGSGVVVPADTAMYVYCDSTSVRAAGTPVNAIGTPVFTSVAASTGVFNGLVAASASIGTVRATEVCAGSLYSSSLTISGTIPTWTVTDLVATHTSTSTLSAVSANFTNLRGTTVNATHTSTSTLNAATASITTLNVGTLQVGGTPLVSRVVQTTMALNTTLTSINSTFNGSTNTGGSAIVEVTLTPTSANSTFVIQGAFSGTALTPDILLNAAIFSNLSSTRLANAYHYTARGSIAGGTIPLMAFFTPATTGQVIVSLRAGAGLGTALANGYYPSTQLGYSYLQITEVNK